MRPGSSPSDGPLPPRRARSTPRETGAETEVPPRWRGDIERILLTEARIARRVRALARQINRDFANSEPIVIPLLSGTVLFVADLIRHLHIPLRLDFLGVSSYREATRPGELVFTKELRLDVRGRDVLLVDDILDSGQTLARVTERLRPLRPRRLRLCVLLEKRVPRAFPIRPDYVGFRIPDAFVVGYGLDYAERFRNLPFIGVLRQPRVAGSRGARGWAGGRGGPKAGS